MAAEDTTRIRRSLDTVENDFITHFQKAGMSEAEAIEASRKMVKRRKIGERVESQAHHDPDKAAANEARRLKVEREKEAAREARERAAHEEMKRRTGRKIFT